MVLKKSDFAPLVVKPECLLGRWDLASKIKTDKTLFWSFVRSKMKTKSSFGELEIPIGNLTSYSQEKQIY